MKKGRKRTNGRKFRVKDGYAAGYYNCIRFFLYLFSLFWRQYHSGRMFLVRNFRAHFITFYIGGVNRDYGSV